MDQWLSRDPILLGVMLSNPMLPRICGLDHCIYDGVLQIYPISSVQPF